MSPASTLAKRNAAILLILLALANPIRALAAPDAPSWDISTSVPDEGVSLIRLEPRRTPAVTPSPGPGGPAKQALDQLLKDLLKLPTTCMFCDLTKKKIWDDVVQEWLRKLGIPEVPGSGSLVCPNEGKVKALLDEMAQKLKASDSLRKLLDLSEKLQGTIPSDSSDANVQALRRALEALERRLRELQDSGADEATKKIIIDSIQHLLWKLINGEHSEFPRAAAGQGSTADGSGLASSEEDCIKLAGTEKHGISGKEYVPW